MHKSTQVLYNNGVLRERLPLRLHAARNRVLSYAADGVGSRDCHRHAAHTRQEYYSSWFEEPQVSHFSSIYKKCVYTNKSDKWERDSNMKRDPEINLCIISKPLEHYSSFRYFILQTSPSHFRVNKEEIKVLIQKLYFLR